MGSAGSAAELFFQLANAVNPSVPVTGVVFTGHTYISVWLPSTGAFAVVNPSQIVEKGLGTYAVQLTSSQTSKDGTAYVFAEIPSVSQPFRDSLDIVNPASPARYELPFSIMPITDPVYDTGGLGRGWVFAPGEVQQRFASDGAFSNALTGQCVERGFNMYALQLTPAQRAANVNAALVAFSAASMITQVAEWDMIVAVYGSSSITPTPAPTPVIVPPPALGTVDQVALGVSRLPAMFKTKVA